MAISLKAGVDPTLPDVQLTIGGKDRKLCYDFAAIVQAEKLTGINLMRAASFQNLSFSDVRGLLYAALLHDDPKLTLEELDRTCGPQIMYNLVTIQGAIAEAWFGSVPDEKDEPAGEEKAQAKNQA